MLFEDVVSMRAGAHAAELDLVKELVSRATLTRELREAFGSNVLDTVATTWVEESISGTFIVARRIQLIQAERDARFWTSCKTRIFGEFKHREHAERWAFALMTCGYPRGTRKLQMKRVEAAEVSISLR